MQQFWCRALPGEEGQEKSGAEMSVQIRWRRGLGKPETTRFSDGEQGYSQAFQVEEDAIRVYLLEVVGLACDDLDIANSGPLKGWPDRFG